MNNCHTRRKARILLSYRRLIYDLSNLAYVVGDGLPTDVTDSSPHARHLVRDLTEGQNRDHADLVLDLAYHQLRGIFQPFLRSEEGKSPTGVIVNLSEEDISPTGVIVNLSEEDISPTGELKKCSEEGKSPTGELKNCSEEGKSPTGELKSGYEFLLWVPPSVTKAHIDRWAILAYEFMMASALADWFAICAPSVAQVWQSRRDTSWRLLSEGVKLHNRRASIRMRPF